MNPIRYLLRALLWFLCSPSRYGFLFRLSGWRVPFCCHPSARLEIDGEIRVKKKVQIGRRSNIRVSEGAEFHMDVGSSLGDDCEVGVLGTVSIGPYTSIQNRSQLHGDVVFGAGCVCAANLYVASTIHHFRDEPYLPIRWQDNKARQKPNALRSTRVTIEDDCWIGINVVVRPGVRIARGAVVGANSVVTKDVQPYSIVAGAPAKTIGSRLDFIPPKQINAECVEDVPYFYSGIGLPDMSMSDWKNATRGGRFVMPKFGLALTAGQGDQLHLNVSVFRPCTLLHAGKEVLLSEGRQQVVFQGVPDDRGVFWFSVKPWSQNSIAIHEAASKGIVND